MIVIKETADSYQWNLQHNKIFIYQINNLLKIFLLLFQLILSSVPYITYHVHLIIKIVIPLKLNIITQVYTYTVVFIASSIQ